MRFLFFTHSLGVCKWKYPPELQKVFIFSVVQNIKSYIMTSKLRIYCLILYVHNLNFSVAFLWLNLMDLVLDYWTCSWFGALQNYDAKLSDFGLARDGPTGDKRLLLILDRLLLSFVLESFLWRIKCNMNAKKLRGIGVVTWNHIYANDV